MQAAKGSLMLLAQAFFSKYYLANQQIISETVDEWYKPHTKKIMQKFFELVKQYYLTNA